MDLSSYYAARALEYESVYAKPERQSDLSELRSLVGSFARERRILEVACGTGYWTAAMAPYANAISATDIGTTVLDIARAKQLPGVSFNQCDAYNLSSVPSSFDAGFAGFWWSHLRVGEIARFLRGLHSRRGNAAVMLLDNRYVEGSSTPISRTDFDGNTYQRRRLADGREIEVLKNFPNARDVGESLPLSGVSAMDVVELEYYWCATDTSGAT